MTEELYQIGLTYLSRQKENESGGIVAFILDNLDFQNGTLSTSRITNLGLWTSYAKEFLFNSSRPKPTLNNISYEFNNLTSFPNPNRELSILMIFWLSTLVLLTLLILVISITNLVRRNVKVKRVLKFVVTRKKRFIVNGRLFKRVLVLFTMVLVVVTWIVFLSLLYSAHYNVAKKIQPNDTNNNQTQNSLSSTVKKSMEYLNNFFHILTNGTSVFILSSISSMNLNMKKQLNNSVVTFGDGVMKEFNITNLFDTARQLFESITEVVNSMTFINNNCQDTLARIDETKGSVTVYQSSLNEYFSKICDKLSMNLALQRQCYELQTKNTNFRTTTNTGAVSSSSSVILLFVLQQYNINISDITNSFYKVDNDFKAKLSALFNSTVDQFDFWSYLAVISNVWGGIVDMISPTLNSTKDYSTIIDSNLTKASTYEFFVIIFIIIITFVAVLLLLLFSFRDSMQDGFMNKCVNVLIQLSFMVVLVSSAVVCLVALIAANFTKSEICNQINSTKGVNLLDQMLDRKLAEPWKTVVTSATLSLPNITLKLVQPSNILSGIKDRCRNSSIGLLSVLGMGKFVNISQIIQSQSVLSVVLKAENDSLKSFLDVNPEQIIPPNMTAFLKQTESIITYFDKFEYGDGILELEKPLVGISNFSEYFKELSQFALDASKVLNWTSELKYLDNTAANLQTKVPVWNDTQTRVTILKKNFIILQKNRKNTFLLNALVSFIVSVKSLLRDTVQLKDMFSNIFKTNITVNLLNILDKNVTSGIDLMTSQMLPCGDLSMVLEVITTSVCSDKDLTVSIATLGIILLIETVLCQMISLITILSISLRINFEANVSKC